MRWINLTSTSEVKQLLEIDSFVKPVLIFKHSTRCSISNTVLARTERKWQELFAEKVTPYYLDLLMNRELSADVALKTNITHESPQMIVLKNGQVIYNQSHTAIDINEVIDLL